MLAALRDLLPQLERRDILAKALTDHGLIASTASLDDAIEFADAYAADALIAVDKARACVEEFKDLKGGDPALHGAMLALDAEREAAKAAQAEAAAAAG